MTYCVPGPALGPGVTAANRTDGDKYCGESKTVRREGCAVFFRGCSALR